MNVGIFLFALSLSVASSMAFGETNLCSKTEAMFFSCTVQSGKIVSLCGDKRMLTWSSSLSYEPFLIYRFGSLSKIELEYPKKHEGSMDEFRYLHMASHIEMGNYDQKEVSFQISRFEYTVFENTLPPPEGATVNPYQAGVSASQKNGKGFVSICKERPSSILTTLEPFLTPKE
jgi:hypothetical protein